MPKMASACPGTGSDDGLSVHREVQRLPHRTYRRALLHIDMTYSARAVAMESTRTGILAEAAGCPPGK